MRQKGKERILVCNKGCGSIEGGTETGIGSEKSSIIPGLRGSHILKVGSEPPAAIRAEASPPTSRLFRTFPQNCKE